MSEGYLCKESFYNNSGADAWTSPIFQLSGPVEFTCVRRFFFLFRGKKEHPSPSSPKQEGRRTPDLRLSGSQIRRQDALTEEAWEDHRASTGLTETPFCWRFSVRTACPLHLLRKGDFFQSSEQTNDHDFFMNVGLMMCSTFSRCWSSLRCQWCKISCPCPPWTQSPLQLCSNGVTDGSP